MAGAKEGAIMTEQGWLPAYPGIKYNWAEEATSFDCPCGAKDIIISEWTGILQRIRGTRGSHNHDKSRSADRHDGLP